MSVLTDLIVADPLHAADVGKNHPNAQYPSIELKGFDQLKAATLWCFLLGDMALDDARVMETAENFETLYAGGPDGPWVYKFPAEFTRLIARLDDARSAEIGYRWSATEEFAGYSQEIVQTWLTLLSHLARRAENESKSVLMWMGL